MPDRTPIAVPETSEPPAFPRAQTHSGRDGNGSDLVPEALRMPDICPTDEARLAGSESRAG